METVARIEGNEDDGWNVLAIVCGAWEVEYACEDREHADDLAALLERCSWFSIREIRA